PHPHTSQPHPTACPLFFLHGSVPHRDLHSFPTRRSSDLCRAPSKRKRPWRPCDKGLTTSSPRAACPVWARPLSAVSVNPRNARQDRKSTRLNSSHVSISYAVFCLKKKKHKSTCVSV